ncbi:hypothetical protein Tco_0651744 [Tanacetum coccineum]|uniref:Uncharacterized protein n=1 Tax=Tanacetum coccineum TaxID=301880 RepID=A0ABQ4WVY6_9ASTR
MSTYLKHMGGYKHSQLKNKSFDETQKLFDKEMTREEEEMKKHKEIVQDDKVVIDAIPLATKPPMIIEYKIDKEEKMGYFKLIRADGSSKRLLMKKLEIQKKNIKFKGGLLGLKDFKIFLELLLLSYELVWILFVVLLMENGFLSPKGRGSGKGVKKKGNDQVHAKMTSIPNMENSKPGIQVDANTLDLSEDGLSAIATKCSTPLMLDSYKSGMCTKSWGRSSFARAMIDLQADVELKDTIVVDVLKLVGKGFSSNSNPFDAANSVENDDDLGTNRGNYKFDDKGSESLSSPTNTPIVIRINNLERQIRDGKLALMDDDGKPLKKVDSPVNSDSESEVEEVFNETTSFMASQSFEKWQ